MTGGSACTLIEDIICKFFLTFCASFSSSLADAKSTNFQPPQVQHGWGGVPGRPSLADIVKMGRPQVKSGGRPVAKNAGMPAVGGSVVAERKSVV